MKVQNHKTDPTLHRMPIKQMKMFESNCMHSLDKIHENHAMHIISYAISIHFTINVHQVHGTHIMKYVYALDSCKKH